MFFNPRSLCGAAILSFLLAESMAVVLRPITTVPNKQTIPPPSKRDNGVAPIQLKPLKDSGELTGKFVKREKKGNSCYDPASENEFLWGAYGEHPKLCPDPQ